MTYRAMLTLIALAIILYALAGYGAYCLLSPLMVAA